jgi:hypothetical protein
MGFVVHVATLEADFPLPTVKYKDVTLVGDRTMIPIE